MSAVLTREETDILRQGPLFHGFTDEELEETLAQPECMRGSFARGERIFSPHAFCRSLGVLLSGTVEVTKGSLIVSILQAGEVFGSAALFNGEKEYVTTLTVRNSCEAVFFPQALVVRLMREYSPFALDYVRYLSGRIRFLSDKIEGLIAGGAEQRLEQYLLRRLEGTKVELDCSATALAKRLNMSRASLYRAFETLQTSGVVKKEGKTVWMTVDTEGRSL